MGSEIIVCGNRFDVGHPVVTFEDRRGYSFYVPHRTDNISKIYASHPARGLERRVTRFRRRRLMGASRSLSRLRTVVRQIVVHLDGCRDAQMCYNVLHNERGLSVHFMVDNDGTIYQGLDLVDCAFHAGGVNEISIGIELQNRGDAARYPNYYPEGRGTVTCRVHGVQFLSYDFTEAQYEAMTRLARLLTRIFDRVSLRSPQSGSGEPIWTTITGLRSWVGFLGHYHVDREKWDPGPFDFKKLFRGIGSRVVFPLHPSKEPKEEEASVQRDYFESSEVDATAHFPIGPLGRSRLWHGGIHLRAAVGSPVGATLRGRIVAAHVAPSCAVGSCSFVLLRHRLVVAAEALEFFSLYFHLSLAQDAGHDDAPWAARLRLMPGAQIDRGEVVLLDEVVEAGEIVGHVGEAGPAGHRRGEIHFAVFSARVGEAADPGYWELVEGQDRSRFCNDPAILERIDRPLGGVRRDGRLSRRELRNFFQLNARRDELRRVVAHHRSEWTRGGWGEVERAAALADLTPQQRKRLVAQQITPTLWWTPAVASHTGLPPDGMVYSYHPLGFLVWLRALQRKHAASRTVGIGTAAQWEGKQAPKHLTIDRESSKGMTDEEDFFAGEEGRGLTLEDLANGYPDD